MRLQPSRGATNGASSVGVRIAAVNEFWLKNSRLTALRDYGPKNSVINNDAAVYYLPYGQDRLIRSFFKRHTNLLSIRYLSGE
jgi:hypothetical protein